MGILARWGWCQDLGGSSGDDPGPQPHAALELRIHGVHGTSPASMLGVKEIRQVAGDGITGVFRTDGDLPRRRVRRGHAVEAYSWGALTSAVRGALGWVQRVLWLGLLPFALVNLAYWARLNVGQDDRRGRWGATAVRWAALLMTVLFVLTACFLSLDLVAWQCYRGGTKSCDVLPGLLDFMMFLAPSQRLAVAAVVPLAVIGVLWFLSRQSLARYESTRRHLHPTSSGEHLLQDWRFWSSTWRTRRLQRIHLAAAIATVMAYVGVQVDQLSGRLSGWTVLSSAILVLSFGAAAYSHLQDLERPEPDADARGPQDARAAWLLRLALLVGATQMLWLFVVEDHHSWDWDSSAGWFGHNLWFIGVVVGMTVVNIAVFVAGRMHGFWSTVTILVFMAGVGCAAWLSLGDDRTAVSVQRVLAVSGAVAAAFFALMLVWQLWQGRRGGAHRAEAWAGGGAAMLVGAAGWIALLFTTAAVTAGANYLNGPDESVADLTSDQKAVQGATPSDEVVEAEEGLVVTLAKGAVLRDGIVVMGTTPQLVRGSVVTKTAEVPDGGVRRTLPDTVVLEGTFAMEDETLLLVNSCRVAEDEDVPSSCHPDTPGFVSGAEVSVTGLSLGLADGGRVRLEVEDPPTTPLVLPQVLVWAPVVQVLWSVLAGLIALACAIRLRAHLKHGIQDLVEAEGVPVESQVDVRRKRLRAAYAHRAERLIELVGAVTVWCVLLLLCLSATGLPPNLLVSTLFPNWRSDLPHLVATLSLYVVLGLSAGLVLLSSYVRRSEATRKAVGILWDLTTFWPRAAHPLSPPCYAERVVPELTTRIRWGLAHHGRIVVSGHSQGSLIAAATLLRLDPGELADVRFVTYGSQLRALYGRIFPAVLGPDVLGGRRTDGTPTFGKAHPDVPPAGAGVAHVVPPGAKACPTLWDLLGEDDWVNLFRRADPLGWRVFSDDDSDHDLCTPEVPLPEAGDPGPTVSTHSGYQHTIQYRRVVAGWLAEEVVDEVAWTIGEVEPLPEP
jgi:hypothetical protein